MALKDRKTMRSLVQVSIKQPVLKDFTAIEIDNLLNMAQMNIARRLLSVNKRWFAKYDSLNVAAGSGDYDTATVPADCLEIWALTKADGTPIDPHPIDDVGSMTTNTCFTPSSNNPRYVQVGTTLMLYGGGGIGSTVRIWYIQLPTELTDDAHETILPIWFVESIVAYVKWKCADRAGLDAKQCEKEYDESFFEAERLLKKDDVKVPLPGKDEK